jgi:hypothetical protein
MSLFQFKTLYRKYFQKSKAFLVPLLGLKKATPFPFIQSYITWENAHTLEECKLILNYVKYEGDEFKIYLLKRLMSNKMFDEYHEMEDGTIALTFDLNCVKEDYKCVVLGKYSQLSNNTKSMIRSYYGYNTAEWAYMESFLYPKQYVNQYVKLLNVEEIHFNVNGELCDKPNLKLETFKLKSNEKHDDVNPLDVEQGKDYQANSDAY